MHGLVTKHAPRAGVVTPDLLEVEQRMASLIGLNDEDDTATPNVASAAAMHHLKTGGQRIRARLALHASNSLGLARDDAYSIESTAELLHNASLIYDDLLGLPAKLALMAANKTDALAVAKRAADSFAIGYQIYDDLLDLQADTARDASMPAINIVQVLQSSHAASDCNAGKIARKLGIQHLMSAAAANADLSYQAGRLFQQLEIEWHTRLTERCFQ